MEYTHLGRLGLRVSRLCLGTMNFGWDVPGTEADEAFAIMDRALEHGINFFDTANVYGWRKDGAIGEGLTEQIIGRWFAQGGGRREKVVLATKVYGKMGEWPNESLPVGPPHRRPPASQSLRRLQTDHIDLYQFHHVDREAPWEEIWQAMETLVRGRQGPLRGQLQLRRLAHRQGQRGGPGSAPARAGLRAVPVQPDRAHRRARGAPGLRGTTGSGVIPWSPLAGGLLGGILAKVDGGRRAGRSSAQAEVEQLRPQIEAYEALCAELGERPADVALAWLLANPVVTAPIIGPRTVGAARWQPARPGDRARRRGDAAARRDLPRAGRARPGGLGLVR